MTLLRGQVVFTDDGALADPYCGRYVNAGD